MSSEPPLHIPFIVHLSDCNLEIADRIGLRFYGVTDQKEPDAFLVTSGDGNLLV